MNEKLKELKERAKKYITPLKERGVNLGGSITWKTIEDLANLPDEPEKEEEWPKEGDDVWYITLDGNIMEKQWAGSSIDKRTFQHGLWRTKEAAENERLRRKSRAEQKWIPKLGDTYYCPTPIGCARRLYWSGDTLDWAYWHMGCVKKTKEEVTEWHKKYGKAFFEDE